jgi:hypothetical protein
MTDTGPHHGDHPPAGHWGNLGDGPGLRHRDIVTLLLRIDVNDTDNPDSWTLNGQPLTPHDHAIVRAATPAAWDDVLTLLDLDREHHANQLERLQRQAIRRTNGITTDEDTP